LGTSTGAETSLSGLDVVEAVAAQKGTSHFARALLYNNVGSIEMALERRDRARTALERASREAASVVGEGAAELLNVQSNLALTTDDPERRDALLVEAEVHAARLLGEDHPDALEKRFERGMMTVSFAKAIEVLGPTCAAFEEPIAEHAAWCWAEVGFLRQELDDTAGAIKAMQRSTRFRVEHGPSAPALPYLHLWQGESIAAAGELQALLEARPARKESPWWDRQERADLELALGRAQRSAGRAGDAKRILISASASLADIADKHPAAAVDRRLGRARAELAKVLHSLGAPRGEVARYATPAAKWLRQAGGSASEIAALDRLSGAPPAVTNQGRSQ
jgi:tetratricopeptide (TPR) repeat protein